jgi:hypothetical protein
MGSNRLLPMSDSNKKYHYLDGETLLAKWDSITRMEIEVSRCLTCMFSSGWLWEVICLRRNERGSTIVL